MSAWWRRQRYCNDYLEFEATSYSQRLHFIVQTQIDDFSIIIVADVQTIFFVFKIKYSPYRNNVDLGLDDDKGFEEVMTNLSEKKLCIFPDKWSYIFQSLSHHIN